MSQEANKHPRISRRHLAIYMLIFVGAPAVTYVAGKWLDQALSMPSLPPFPLNLLVGLVVFFSGLAIGIKSTRLLFKFGKGLPWGEVNGKSQTQKLVTDGPYAYTRNPMTLGYSLLPCGMGIMFQSIGMTLFISAITFLAATTWARFKEEPSLDERFGEAYREYKRKTPFLIPRPKPLILSLVRLAQKQGNRSDSFSPVPIIFTIISLLGLCLLAVLLFYPATAVMTLAYQKHLIGLLFAAICVMGAMAGTTPSRCSQMLHFKNPRNANPHRVQEMNPKEEKVLLKGHHPACGSFSAHVFQIGDRIYCAGCTALVTGAAMALVGTALYFFVGLGIGGFGPLVFWLGFVGVACGLLQYLWFASKASIHFFLDIFFVIGAFFLLVGVDDMNGSLGLELYLLVMILYWIFSRTVLSRWEHKKKCARCNLGPCGFVE